jgi:hypothetical protein
MVAIGESDTVTVTTGSSSNIATIGPPPSGELWKVTEVYVPVNGSGWSLYFGTSSTDGRIEYQVDVNLLGKSRGWQSITLDGDAGTQLRLTGNQNSTIIYTYVRIA